MASNELRQRAVATIYHELARDPAGEKDPLAPTLAALGADSLDAIQISMALEEEFGIEISDAEAESFTDVEMGKTVGDWWALIEPKLGSAVA